MCILIRSSSDVVHPIRKRSLDLDPCTAIPIWCRRAWTRVLAEPQGHARSQQVDQAIRVHMMLLDHPAHLEEWPLEVEASQITGSNFSIRLACITTNIINRVAKLKDG